MRGFFISKNNNLTFRCLSNLIVFVLSFSLVFSPSIAYAQSQFVLNLPIPGAMVQPTGVFMPVLIKGISIHPENSLEFDFIVDSGDSQLEDEALKVEAEKLIKYFLASLTVPNEDLWVNLSPYEQDKIISEGFGQTEMGRDMLVQDYMLKQLTASMIYPEDKLGSKFWNRVYSKAQEMYGTTDIPMNTFNKIWIVPEKADVYEHNNSVFVVNSYLKVMLEEDYVALQENLGIEKYGLDSMSKNEAEVISGISSEVVKNVLIPEIEKEINTGSTFANLRQIYNSVILATWYKMNLKESLLGQIYVDRTKTKGVDVKDKEVNQKIYNQYVESFKKGVFDYIKEDYDSETKQVIPRKYFSGGSPIGLVTEVLNSVPLSEVDGSFNGRGNKTFIYSVRGREIVASPLVKDMKMGKVRMEGIVDAFTRDMEAGLAGRDSSLAMLESHLKNATGNEEGEYIAVDWGGSNLRVMLVELSPGKAPVVKKTVKMVFSEDQRTGNQKELFDVVAEKVKELGLDEGRDYSLGFTFSYPTELTSVNSGKLIKWVKGWDVSGVVGEDVVQLLQHGLNRQGMENVKITAVLNDTVGTQLTVPGAVAGVILGSGHNISIYDPVADQLINMESGGFDGIPMTSYDQQIFENIAPKSDHAFEKMVSGMYLGEVVRLRLLDLHEQGKFRDGQDVSFLEQEGSFESELISEIEGAEDNEAARRIVSNKFGFMSSSDTAVVREVSRVVSVRAGRMIAAAFIAVVKRTDPEIANNHLIGIDGSVYEYHPNMDRYIREGMAILVGKKKASQIDLKLTKDGSGIGAAMAAAVAEGQSSSPLGGINFNPDLINLQIKRDGKGIPLPVWEQPIGTMRIDGIIPIIINVAPISIPMMLGLADPPAACPSNEGGKANCNNDNVQTFIMSQREEVFL